MEDATKTNVVSETLTRLDGMVHEMESSVKALEARLERARGLLSRTRAMREEVAGYPNSRPPRARERLVPLHRLETYYPVVGVVEAAFIEAMMRKSPAMSGAIASFMYHKSGFGEVARING